MKKLPVDTKIERRGECESGQAMTEYITMVAIFLGVALMLIVLLDAFSEYGWRLLSLVGMDYP
ncbi:MAG: hypothetical protein GXP32_10415 [Kiritimatiellaeota bacterium]|nr:hypothetical protein [Kiritimatiellota bacterium]